MQVTYTKESYWGLTDFFRYMRVNQVKQSIDSCEQKKSVKGRYLPKNPTCSTAGTTVAYWTSSSRWSTV